MRCVVCQREGATEHPQDRACDAECWALLVLARLKEHTPYERALLAWDWRRRRAQVSGREFTEPPPKSGTEKELDAWAAQFDPELL